MEWVSTHGSQLIGLAAENALKVVRAAGFRPELYTSDDAPVTARITAGQVRVIMVEGRVAQVSAG